MALTGFLAWLTGCLAMPAAVLAAAPSGPSGTWSGDYVCAQGVTALTLDVVAGGGNRVAAVFAFSPVAENPAVPVGCFEMSGTYDPARRHLALTPGRWLLQPDGFVTVGLSGDVAADGNTLEGSVTGPGCSRFSLRRISASPYAGAAACQPARVVASLGR